MQYNFELAGIQCQEPRSGSLFGKGTDSVYISFSVGIFDAVGSPLSQPTANWGPQEVNSGGGGNYPVNLFLPNLEVPDGGSVVVVAVGANKGGGLDPGFMKTLDGAAGSLSGAGAAAAIGALASIPVAGWVAAVGAIVGTAFVEFLTVAFPNCDGPLFGTNFKLTRQGLDHDTASGALSITQFFPGSDSASGCGDNSKYSVHLGIGRSPGSGHR
jgi:hypothetical protein